MLAASSTKTATKCLVACMALGVSCVNGLSEWLRLSIQREWQSA
jgi:DNA gyrase/topoisomerase IV subunit B